MIGRSLLARLTVLSGILILLALALGGVALTWLFEREVERRAVYDLTQHLQTLAAQVRIDNGQPVLDAEPADPRFNEPYSGLYWQIETAAGERLRSRSLWDFNLPADRAASTTKPHVGLSTTSSGVALISVSRRVVLESPAGAGNALITVALDRRDIVTARSAFLQFLIPSLLVLAALLTAAMATFLHMALRPFRTLSTGLKAIHSGATRTLSGRFPDEVQPVVDDLNRLIAFQDVAVTEARAHAGDLAHGLKTPLAILGAVARDMTDRGQADLADDIGEQVHAMDSHVRRALARARVGLVGRLSAQATPVRPVLTKAIEALDKLNRPRDLQWQLRIDGEPLFDGDPGDLTEILGNLLDNAGKWASRTVSVTAAITDGRLRFAIEDDGPGMPDHTIDSIARGQRWDNAVGGTGFGLAIVRDLVAAYGGALTFERADGGGLRVVMTFPAGQCRGSRA
jgi:signal transduction histidine kinase